VLKYHEKRMTLSESRRQLLSIGVFLIILVVAILLVATNILVWTLIVPLVLALFGIWILALAVMRRANPQNYERSSFSTMAIGLCLIVIGGAWYLVTFNWLYSLALILLALAAIAIVAALGRK
jgi:O-antigen/teichoic acid export membrane protein